MKELYYYKRQSDEEIKKCPVIREAPRTYVIKIDWGETIVRKAKMTAGDYFSQVFVFETEEQAKASHLEYLKSKTNHLEEEAKRYTDEAERYKSLIKELYGGVEK